MKPAVCSMCLLAVLAFCVPAASARGPDAAGAIDAYLHGTPAESVAAARILDELAHRGIDAERAASLGAALDWLQDEIQGASAVPPRSPALPDLLEAAARTARALASRTGHEERQRELIHWVGLCGTPAQVAALDRFTAQPATAEAAVAALASVDAPETAEALLLMLDTSRGALRRTVIAACAQRGLRAAVAPLRDLARSTSDDETRWACLEALSRLGVPPAEVVPLGPGADPALAARYANANLRAALLLGAAGDRGKAQGLLYRFVDLYARRYQINAALLGLARLNSDNLTRAALRFVNTPGVRETALRVLRESRDPALEDTLVEAWPVTDPSMKAAILDILSARGHGALPALLEEALASDSPELRVTAARLTRGAPGTGDLFDLAERGAPWTRGPALEDLFAQAATRAEAGDTTSAVPVFQRIAGGRFPAGARRRAVLELGAYAPAELLEFVAQLRTDPEIGGAAEQACVAMAARQPDPDKARETLRAAVAATRHEEAASEAAAHLATRGDDIGELARARGYVLDWELLGPIPLETPGDSEEPPFGLDRGDPPRRITAGGVEYAWAATRATGLPAVLDLPDTRHGRVFALARVPASAWIPATAVVRYTGADARLWHNGRLLVRESARESALAAGAMDCTLAPGINRFVVELVHKAGPWNFSLQLAGRGGKPLDVSLLALPDDGARGAGVRVEALLPVLEDSAP